MTTLDGDVDDRFAGIDIDSLLNSRTSRQLLGVGRKKALYESPEFIQRLNGEETVLEGQSCAVECKVRGFPAPTIRWFKDDEEILDHPRIHVEGDGKGGYCLMIDHVNKGDEAAYRCRAENIEGQCTCIFFLSVRGKRKNKKRKKDSKSSPNKRTVSFPPMFSTIVEKVEEEEKQGKEFETLPPSPLTEFYYALTLKSRQTWPTFVGDWAFSNGGHRSISNEHRRNSTGSIDSSDLGITSDEEILDSISDELDDTEDDDGDDDDDDADSPPKKKSMFYIDESDNWSRDDEGENASPFTSDDGLFFYNKNFVETDVPTTLKNVDSGSNEAHKDASNTTGDDSDYMQKGVLNTSDANSSSLPINTDSIKTKQVSDEDDRLINSSTSKGSEIKESNTQNEDFNAQSQIVQNRHEYVESFYNCKANALGNTTSDTTSESLKAFDKFSSPKHKKRSRKYRLDGKKISCDNSNLRIDSEDLHKTVSTTKANRSNLNTGECTPPIVVEVWHDQTVSESKSPKDGSPSREEREPTPFFKDSGMKPTSHLPLQPQQSKVKSPGLFLTIPKSNTLRLGNPERGFKDDGTFHREPTPIPDFGVDSPEGTTDDPPMYLCVPSGEFSNVRAPRESTPTPFAKTETQHSDENIIGSSLVHTTPLLGNTTFCASPDSSPTNSPTSSDSSSDASPESATPTRSQNWTPPVNKSALKANESAQKSRQRSQKVHHHPHYYHHVARTARTASEKTSSLESPSSCNPVANLTSKLQADTMVVNVDQHKGEIIKQVSVGTQFTQLPKKKELRTQNGQLVEIPNTGLNTNSIEKRSSAVLESSENPTNKIESHRTSQNKPVSHSRSPKQSTLAHTNSQERNEVKSNGSKETFILKPGGTDNDMDLLKDSHDFVVSVPPHCTLLPPEYTSTKPMSRAEDLTEMKSTNTETLTSSTFGESKKGNKPSIVDNRSIRNTAGKAITGKDAKSTTRGDNSKDNTRDHSNVIQTCSSNNTKFKTHEDIRPTKPETPRRRRTSDEKTQVPPQKTQNEVKTILKNVPSPSQPTDSNTQENKQNPNHKHTPVGSPSATTTVQRTQHEKDVKHTTNTPKDMRSVPKPKPSIQQLEDSASSDADRKVPVSKHKGKKSSQKTNFGSASQKTKAIAACSPFGKYNLEGFVFIVFITGFSLYVQMGVEKLVCYILASYYTFFVLRILGLLE